MPINGTYTLNQIVSEILEKYGASELLDVLTNKCFDSPNRSVSYPDYSSLTGALEKLTDRALEIEAGKGDEGGQSDEQQ